MAIFMLHILKMNLIAAIVIVLAILFARFTKGKYSSKWKYDMWLAVMIFLLLPFDFSVKSPVRIQIHESETIGEPVKAAKAVPGETEDPAAAELLAGKQEAFRNSSPQISWSFLLKTMFGVWITGIVFFGIIRGLKYYYSLHHMMRWSYPANDAWLLKVYAYVCRKKRIKNPPKLLVCEGLSSPMLAGLRKPALYVPAEDYGMEELEFIFSHELSHYVRRDLWYKMLLMAVTTIYWFDPALYLMQREAEKDVENLCDGKMAANYNRQERRKYGELLLKIAAFQNHVPYLSVSLNDSKKVFKDRILYMKNLKHLKERMFPAVLLTVVMTASHMLVGISFGEVPVKAELLQEAQTDRKNAAEEEPVVQPEDMEEKAEGELISMNPLSGENPYSAGIAADSEGEAVPAEDGNQAPLPGVKEQEPEEGKEDESGDLPLDEDWQTDEEQTEDSASGDGTEESGQPALTGEMTTVYGVDTTGAAYIYAAEDGNWYDGAGDQYYAVGGGEWIETQTGLTWTDEAPPSPADSAVDEANIHDEEKLNYGTLYLGEDGVWRNGANGIYSDNGDGTWTGPDGMIWYS